MNLKLLSVMIAGCLLLGCAHSKNGVSTGKNTPVTDLDALVSNAKRDLAPRYLPNGKLYCAELSKNQKAMDACTGDLEDLALNSETDKEVGLSNLMWAVERIKLRLNPCGFWKRTFKKSECTMNP